jgi:signal transduction histidine kinase
MFIRHPRNLVFGGDDGGGTSPSLPQMGEAIWGRIGHLGEDRPFGGGDGRLTCGVDCWHSYIMAQPVNFDDAINLRLDPFRYVTRVNRVAAVLGLVFFTLAVVCAWLMFRPFVPPSHMLPWLVGSGAFLLSWLMIDIILLFLNTEDPSLFGLWENLANYVRLVSNLIVLATVWLFLPFVPHDLQLTMTIFYVAHVSTQILTMPGRGPINAIGSVIVLGSVTICTLINGGSHSISIAIFVGAFCVVTAVLSLVVSQLIGDVMAQRRQSDVAALRLEDALAAVAAERDAKTRFMAAASHDLGQPLQAASLYFDQTLMARDLSQRTNAIEGVRKAFDATEQLLAHMLNHLRLDADAVEPQFSKIKLAALFQSLASQYKPLAQTKGLDIAVFAGGQEVYTDKVLLERALGNLINNAINHSQGTRVFLVARALSQARLRIWVLDDGRGVCADDAPSIFSDYYRGQQASGFGVVGFGLGLSSVKRIAQLLGGDAGLDHGWTSGAAFYVDLAAGSVQNLKRKPS